MTTRLCSLLVAGLVLASAPASAQDDERARLHFESGRAYFEEGAYERALQEFTQSYELSNRTGLLFNIGTTQERLGLYAEAATSFETYLQRTPDMPDRAVLERRIANNRARAARGDRADPEPSDEPTEPAVEETSTTTPAPSGGGGDGLILGGAVALAVAGAAAVTFAIVGGLALAEQSAIESGCFQMRNCTPDDVAAMDAFALGADVTWPIALVAGAAGGVLLALGMSAGGDGRASVTVVPVVTAAGAAVCAGGSF